MEEAQGIRVGSGDATGLGSTPAGDQASQATNDPPPPLGGVLAPRLLAAQEETPHTAQLPNLAQAALDRLREREEQSKRVLDSPDDFQPVKKLRISDTWNDDDQEGQICSICFEPWSNSGSHRIASLKCGHLFGYNCIEKWLKSSLKCPQCNAKAKKCDIRVIYAKAISVVDTTDRDRSIKETEEEKAQRIQAQKSEAQAVLQYQLARAECDKLKFELCQLKKQLEQYPNPPPSTSTAVDDVQITGDTPAYRRQGEYRLLKTISVSQDGSGRVMAYDSHTGMLVASKRSSNNLMPGYGLTKLSTADLRHSEYVSVHAGIVRDAVFSPTGDGMVLTASMDKTAKLTSMHSNTVVQTFQTPVPVWACAWDSDNPNYLYCGLQNGRTLVYDIRVTSDRVAELARPVGGHCPITSLSYVPLCRASTLNCSGLLMGTLDGGFFWEKKNSGDFAAHPLHTLPEGTCTCLSFDENTRHCLASFRPSRRAPHSRHILCQLHNVPADKPFSCKLIHQFTGTSTHKLLSRSKLFHRPGDDNRLLAAFGEESTKSVQIWDAATTSKLQQLSLESHPALDLLPFCYQDQDCLAVLTEAQLFVYNWQWKVAH